MANTTAFGNTKPMAIPGSTKHSPAAQRRANQKAKAIRDLRRKWTTQCITDDDENTELILDGVDIPIKEQHDILFATGRRVQKQFAESYDIGQDEHERLKQEEEGVYLIPMSRGSSSSSSSSESSEDSDGDEGGYKRWLAGGLYLIQKDEDKAKDEGGLKAWDTTPKDQLDDEWRFGRGTSTAEKATETCNPQ